VSPIERVIVRYRPARYAFVLISFPFIAIKDRVAGVRNPLDLHALRNALKWARRGGDPAKVLEHPDPAPFHPKWQDPEDTTR
jgi:hypothetical protein